MLLVLCVMGSSLQEENVNWSSERGLSVPKAWAACLWCGVSCHEQEVTLLGFPVVFCWFCFVLTFSVRLRFGC